MRPLHNLLRLNFSTNAIRELEEEVELAKENVDIKLLKSAEEEIKSLLGACKRISEEARKVEMMDRQIIEKIRGSRETILGIVREKRIYAIISKQFRRIAETERVKQIVDVRVTEIEKAHDPATLLYLFGKGVDESLEVLAKEMEEFVRGLESEEAGIKTIFQTIYDEISEAKEGLKKVHDISGYLKGIMGSLKSEMRKIENIKDLLEEIEEKDVKRLKEELKRIEKAVTAEERVRLEVLQKRHKLLEEYFEHLREMFNKAQNALKALENDIKEVEILSDRLSNPFVDVEGELGEIKEKTEKLLEGLRNAIENHKNSLHLLRNRILYRIREICVTLLKMEKHVKEEERRKEIARAS